LTLHPSPPADEPAAPDEETRRAWAEQLRVALAWLAPHTLADALDPSRGGGGDADSAAAAAASAGGGAPASPPGSPPTVAGARGASSSGAAQPRGSPPLSPRAAAAAAYEGRNFDASELYALAKPEGCEPQHTGATRPSFSAAVAAAAAAARGLGCWRLRCLRSFAAADSSRTPYGRS